MLNRFCKITQLRFLRTDQQRVKFSLSLCRLRSRNFGSADDILGLLKEEDEEEERSSPSSHHQLSTSRHSMLSKTSSMHQHTSVSALGKADSQTLLVPPKVSSTFHPSVSTASLPTAMLSASIDMCPDTPAVSLISELKRAITQLPLGDYPSMFNAENTRFL